ncbi:hypothetical protein Pla123a_48370 [Posidoniimonas polymericola]|uniref:HEAT repeat protein n=1 Tax=Posidoniimonas polymericola TaxID=2528002 RepID=A0A5C5XRQ6_9BACT|nr:hypothetical protein [Posidoniimonas polymericola]TWT65926.1 hypothetical protein Pla123a_48370 [Posidoniimonas polymericola]
MLRTIAAIGLVLSCVTSASGMGMESFGNDCLSALNYRDWPGAIPVINSKHRVYHQWVNGNESFYYQGSTADLNDALADFARIKADRLAVVIHPGPGETHSFNQERQVEFDWQLHLLGGIAKHMATLPLGSNVWDPNPYLHIYLGDGVELDALRIPAGVDVLELADLQTRYAKALESTDQSVRGWTCGRIASLDPYRRESMQAIARMLNDSDDWVRLNAAGALATFTTFSDEAIHELEAVETNDEKLQERIDKSIQQLRDSQHEPDKQQAFQQQLDAIHAYVEALTDR